MTKNFGIIGNPIKHSLSPVLHNYWFQKYKIDANYSTIEIYDNELSEIVRKIFVNLFENSGFKDIKINEKVDFEELYKMKKAQ